MFAAFFSGSNVGLTTAVYAYYAYLSSVQQPRGLEGVGMSIRAASLQPALDVGPQPAASAAGAFLREGPGAHPAVDGAAVPTGDPLDIARAEHLIDSGYTLG